MSRTKYTRELLEPLVKESTSIAQVLRKLGLREGGGTHSHISRKIKGYDLDTSHFLGQAANCGTNHTGGPKKKEWQERLVRRKNGRRQDVVALRRALIESGREYKCEECGQLPLWNGKELRLQVDHKNGDWQDDRPENVRFLCPHCHTQTKGYNGSKGYSEGVEGVTSVAKYCRIVRKRKRNQSRVAER